MLYLVHYYMEMGGDLVDSIQVFPVESSTPLECKLYFGRIPNILKAVVPLYHPSYDSLYVEEIPKTVELNKPYLSEDGLTTPTHWDCECEEDFIHDKVVSFCSKCNTSSEDSPDSHYLEVIDWLKK